MWYLPDRYKIGSPGIPRSTFNFDAYVMRLLPLCMQFSYHACSNAVALQYQIISVKILGHWYKFIEQSPERKSDTQFLGFIVA